MDQSGRYPRRTQIAKPSYDDDSDSGRDFAPLPGVISYSDEGLPDLPTTFTTPQTMMSRTASAVASQDFTRTPFSHGAGAVSAYKEELEDAKHFRDNYRTYLREDLATNRVLVDKDDFLEVVYNISRQERQSEAHKELLKKITTNGKFDTAWKKYVIACKNVGGGPRPEIQLYAPRVAVYDAALAILEKHDSIKISEEKKRIRFYVNDPVRLKHGVYANGLSVDIGQVSQSLFGKEKPSLKGSPHPLGAAMLLGAEELKATPGCLITGKKLLYKAMNLKDGRAPEVGASQDDPAPEDNDDPFVVDRARATQQQLVDAAPDSSDDDMPMISQPSGAKKRKGGSKSIPSINKVSRSSLFKPKVASKYEEVDAGFQMPEKLTNAQIQCASYAMEALSLTPLRSHFIMSLVDRTKLQLMYFDSSVMLVTPPVDMEDTEKENGKELYLSMIVGLRRMSLPDRGVRDLIRGNHKFFTCLDFFGRKLTHEKKVPPNWRNMLTGMTLDTPTGGSYIIEDILFRQAGIVGRLTYVVRAKKVDPNTSKAVGPSLVIKLSLPSVSRKSEVTLVAQARQAAEEESGKDHWVLKHLPKILHSEDIGIVSGSTQDRVAKFIHDAGRFEGAKYPYEYRVLRIVVLEELYPISTLGEPSHYAQVFFDILNCHKWLHDIPRILHRDISMSNVMYRFDDDGNVCGVLNDMDLSSDLNDLEDLKATSMRRTGTPPFMAIDLLRKDSVQPDHIYRHDLESLLYVMLILFTRYELMAAEPTSLPTVDRGERLVKMNQLHAPLREWFDAALSWDTLAEKKYNFVTYPRLEDSPFQTENMMSSSFADFTDWISDLIDALGEGLIAQIKALKQAKRNKKLGKAPSKKPFSNATLGGKFQYSTFFDVMKNFGDIALRAPPYSLDTNPTA